jgi:hypothetical protein
VGVTFLEILLSLLILSFALGGLYRLFSFSNRGLMDSYQETMAYSLAQEGLEWVSGLGYENLVEVVSGINPPLVERLREIGFDRPGDVKPVECADGKPYRYPEEYRRFQRHVEIEHVKTARVILIRISVWPQGSSFVRTLMRKDRVVLEKIVGADYGE